MTIQERFPWIEKIDEALYQLDEKPQFGKLPPFPLTDLQNILSRLFDVSPMRIEHAEKGWKKGEDLFEGLGEKLSILAVEWTPLETPLYFVLSEQDLKELMGDLLGGEEAATPFFDPALAEGFFHYLALEVLQALETLRYLAPLSPRIAQTPADLRQTVADESCFLSDVSLHLHKKTVWGRLLIPHAFRAGWKRTVASLPDQEISIEEAAKIPVEVKIEVGECALTVEEWEGVKGGDFIVLDRCSYQPDVGKGSATLRLGENPIFRGRFKPEGMKLSEYPLYEEGRTMMDEDDLEQEQSPPLEGEFVAQGAPDIEALPLHLTVEVGRCRMSLKELKELSPGNMLELDVAPQQGVDLVINGKRVGRGELVQIGETVGVRILSL